jgi:predicted MFS family arabinose efflux permease
VFLAFSAVLAIVDSFAGRLAASVGSRLPMAAGMALCAVAFLLLLLLTPTSGLTIVILALLVAGSARHSPTPSQQRLACSRSQKPKPAAPREYCR